MSNEIDTQEAGENHPKYRLDHFEGPLDLLLFLIRKNEVSIYDIPVAEITEQYLEYLRYASSVDLDGVSDFYLVVGGHALVFYIFAFMPPIQIVGVTSWMLRHGSARSAGISITLLSACSW